MGVFGGWGVAPVELVLESSLGLGMNYESDRMIMIKGIGGCLGTLGLASAAWWTGFFTNSNEIFKWVISLLTIVALFLQIRHMLRKKSRTLHDLKEETTTT